MAFRSFWVDPFGTAVPRWGQTSQISSTFSPKRDCGAEGVKEPRHSEIILPEVCHLYRRTRRFAALATLCILVSISHLPLLQVLGEGYKPMKNAIPGTLHSTCWCIGRRHRNARDYRVYSSSAEELRPWQMFPPKCPPSPLPYRSTPLNPFDTLQSHLWDEATQIMSGLSPTRDCSTITGDHSK